MSKESTAGISSRSIPLTIKSNCLTYTVASSLVCTSPLAVTTVVGLLDILMVSNSAELRSLLLFICILAPESTTNSLSSGTFVECPFFRGRVECSLVLFFELVSVFGKVPCLALGASQLYCSLFLRSVLKLHSVGTSLMRNFDIDFSQRWSSVFLDTRKTWRRLSESYHLNWFQDFCIRFHRDTPLWETSESESCDTRASESCDTQPNCDTLFTIATAFLSTLSLLCGNSRLSLAFCLVVHEPHVAGTKLITGFATRFIFVELALGRMPIFARRSRAGTFQIPSGQKVAEFIIFEF